jgi:tRNA (guanine37-N1)-methyltransferase
VPLAIDVITIFPGMLGGFLDASMLKRAAEHGAVRFRTVDPRTFTSDVHRTTDDRPYGGGPGMVMKPEPLTEAVESVRTPEARVLLMTPQGRRFDQSYAETLAAERHLVFVCGHYEGVDERVRMLADDEVSIGDYVLTNGALAAAVVIDAVVRLLPGVLGGAGATEEESFRTGGLEYPQYTRPPVYRGMAVPEILRSGDHGAIAAWRREQAQRRTRERRPDLLKRDETKTSGRGPRAETGETGS